jgi:hypothetical protein
MNIHLLCKGLMTHHTQIDWQQAPHPEYSEKLAQASFYAYQQHPAYGAALHMGGIDVFWGQIYLDGVLVGLMQCAARRYLKYFSVAPILRGPVWLQELAPPALSACYRALRNTPPFTGRGIMPVMPETTSHDVMRAAGYQRIVTGYTTILMPLTASEDTLLDAMGGKWRNRLHAAQKQSLRISRMGKSHAHYAWLLEKEQQQANHVGYHALPTAVVPLYQQSYGTGAVLALQAEYAQEVVGGVLLLRHGDYATYHIGWSNEVGKAHHVHNALLWEAVLRLKKQGVAVLDLGGIHTEKSAAGLARFKLGLHNAPHRLAGTYL